MAELAPTSTHLALSYIMGLDLYPTDTLEAKKRFLPQALYEGWVISFDNDPKIALSRIRQDNGRYNAESAEG